MRLYCTALFAVLAASLGGCSSKDNAGAGGAASSGGGSQPGSGASGPANGASVGSGKFGGPTGEPTGGGGFDSSIPTPSATWVNVTGNLANLPSECGNLTLLSAVPKSHLVIAGVALKGLYGSTDGGQTWDKLGTGPGSAVITNRPSAIVYDPEHEDVFWESGIYNGGGVYKTTDGGKTFQQLGTIGHNDLVSVDFTDPDRKTLLAGGHEQKQTLYLSTDGGKNFNQIGMNLPSDSHFSSDPLVIDAKTFFLGACGWGDGTCGVYRSTDGGKNWDRLSDLPVNARPLWASDNSIYWPTIYDGGLVKGVSSGRHWSQIASGVTTAFPVELPDKRIVVIQGDHLVISSDGGATFTPIGETLPFKAAGVTYSVERRTFFIWQWDCGNIVLPNAIASAGFDYTKD